MADGNAGLESAAPEWIESLAKRARATGLDASILDHDYTPVRKKWLAVKPADGRGPFESGFSFSFFDAGQVHVHFGTSGAEPAHTILSKAHVVLDVLRSFAPEYLATEQRGTIAAGVEAYSKSELVRALAQLCAADARTSAPARVRKARAEAVSLLKRSAMAELKALGLTEDFR